MNRGVQRKANYGDKGGVYIPTGMFGNPIDHYLNAVVIGFTEDAIITVFLQCGWDIKIGDIRIIDKKQWHGSAFLS